MPVISVILPSLNMRDYIEECLESILNQTYTDLEIISVDAMSDDGTIDILKKYAQKDSRIVLKTCAERSYGKQVNIGIREAAGDYIAIVDTDDYISNDMYEKLLYYAQNNNLDYVKADYIRHYQFNNGNYYDEKCRIIPQQELKNRVINASEYPILHSWDGYLWCGLYRKKFLIDNNIFLNESKGAAFQDVGFFHQVTGKAERVMYVDFYGYYYRINRAGNSISSYKGVEYMYQEYSRLLEEKYIFENNTEQWRWIYIKMVYSLIAETEKETVLLNINKPEVDDYLEKYICIIKDAILNKIICTDDFDEGYNNALHELMTNRDKYVELQMKRIERKKAFIILCKQKSEKKQIVIFGSGIRGKHIYNILRCNNLMPYAFVDNDSSKWGETVYGEQIISLEQLKGKKYVYIVAIKNHEEDVKQQLIHKGVLEDDIVIPCIFNLK